MADIFPKKQGFIQALLLTSVFYDRLNFMTVGHNFMCVSMLTLATGGSYGVLSEHSLFGVQDNVPESFGYFIDPTFSNSLSMHQLVMHGK